MSTWLMYCIGFLAQLLFASRLIVQWVVSEKEKMVVAPTMFWILSLLASVLLFLYGLLREDLAIMLGQVLTYYIYIRNLQLQNKWQTLSIQLRWSLLILPICFLLYHMLNNTIELQYLISHPEIPKWLLILGLVSQIFFSLRFVIQWLDSEKHKTSILPLSFWIVSLIGAFMILTYAVFRLDIVLLAGHSFGAVIYVRNIQLGLSQSQLTQSESKL